MDLRRLLYPPVVQSNRCVCPPQVEWSQVNNNILLFFQHQFLELRGHRCGLDGWLNKEQLDHLCQQMGGIFIYTAATVKFINKQNNNPRKRLDLLLQSPENSVHEGKTELKTNTTLDSLYMSILQEAFSKDDPEDDLRICLVLSAVTLATNPISLSTIAALLGFNTEDVFPLLESAHSLLILQEDVDHPVQLFHKSFPDFIVDPARCVIQRFYVPPPSHYTELLIGCLELMGQRLEQNMCKLPDSVVNSEVEEDRKSVV